MFHETAFVASGQMWCRVGVAMKLSAGSTLGMAQVGLIRFGGRVDSVRSRRRATEPG